MRDDETPAAARSAMPGEFEPNAGVTGTVLADFGGGPHCIAQQIPVRGHPVSGLVTTVR